MGNRNKKKGIMYILNSNNKLIKILNNFIKKMYLFFEFIFSEEKI